MAIENTYLTGSGVQLGTSHFDLQAQKPLDSRTTVPAFAGLQALIDGKAAYEGMIVYDEETKKTYQAQKVDGVLKFREFGINQAEIKDIIASEVTSAMEFMGAVTELPTNLTEADEGHFYKIARGYKTPDDVIQSITDITTTIGSSSEVARIPAANITKGVVGIEIKKCVHDSDGKLVYPRFLHWDISAYAGEYSVGSTVTGVVLNEDGTKAYLRLPEVNEEEYGAIDGYVISVSADYYSEYEGDYSGEGQSYTVSGDIIDGHPLQTGDTAIWHNNAWSVISSGDDLNDTWRPVTNVKNDATLTFVAGDKLDVVVASDGNITYKHKEIDAPTNTTNAEAGDLNTRTYLTAVETDGFGHITGYKTATENVEDTNTTYTFEGQSTDPTSVYFQVTSNEENASPEVVYLDAYSKNEANEAFKAKRAQKLEAAATDANVFVDTVAQDENGDITITTKAVDFSNHYTKTESDDLLDDKLDKSVYDAYIADKAMTDEALKTHATNAANTAEQNAKDYTDDQIEALGTMANETATDYVKKSDATGYTDILTKTEAQNTYRTSDQVDGQIDAKITGLDLPNTYQAKGDYASAAQGEKADTAVQTISTPADTDGEPNGLKAVKTGTDVAISIDDTVTFVFDCGGAFDE